MPRPKRSEGGIFRIAGLFAGIGGIELGLSRAGHESVMLCEMDAGAAHVLKHRFPTAKLTGDVRTLHTLGDANLVAAGFPCQDLSQAGRTAGIGGRNPESFTTFSGSLTLRSGRPPG